MLNVPVILYYDGLQMHSHRYSIKRLSITVISFLVLGLLTAYHKAESSTDTTVSPIAATANPLKILKEREAGVETSDEVRELISQYLQVADREEFTADAKTRAASLYLLLGAKYARSKADKRRNYRRANELTVEAMSMNADFRAALEDGQKITDAAVSLEEDMFEPLFLWATSIFYHFRDVASVPEKILSRKKLSEAAKAIEVLINKDPEWNNGSLQFSLGIYYLSVPGFAGGDRGKAIELINHGVSANDKTLLPRWGRAKYLCVATGDRRQFTDDLEWILKQDILEMSGPTIWNKYFQAESRDLLESVDKFF